MLSDIHFGKFSGYESLGGPKHSIGTIPGYAPDILENLISTVQKCGRLINWILVPGDLTSIADPEEFIGCRRIVEQIAQELAVDKGNIFYTFGNHDTNWEISRKADEPTPGSKKSWHEVASQIGRTFIDDPQDVEIGPLVGSYRAIRPGSEIIVINTGYASTHDQPVKSGVVGARQMQWLQNVLTKPPAVDAWRVVALHHHPRAYSYPLPFHDYSAIAEGSELLDMFGKSGVDFVCHGHRHHPILRTINENGWKHPMTFLCAGSTGVNEEHRSMGEIPNTFHIVDITSRHQSGSAGGQVHTYEFGRFSGWQPVVSRPAIALDHLQKFGIEYSRTQAKNDITTILRGLRKQKKKSAKLPNHTSLPDSLQCATLAELNAMFGEVAASLNGVLYGKYPEMVLVQWP